MDFFRLGFWDRGRGKTRTFQRKRENLKLRKRQRNVEDFQSKDLYTAHVDYGGASPKVVFLAEALQAGILQRKTELAPPFFPELPFGNLKAPQNGFAFTELLRSMAVLSSRFSYLFESRQEARQSSGLPFCPV